jgi:hypothetical protein
MAIMIPPVIGADTKSPGEHEVFKRLRDDPSTTDWIVLHSLDIARHLRQVSGEIDFVVIIPHLGVLCVEVKAHRKIERRPDGMWIYGSDPKPDHRGPFKQASDAMHSLKKQVFAMRSDLAAVPFWTAVVMPYVTFGQPSTEWHAWQLIDSAKYRSRPISACLSEVLTRARQLLAATPTARWFDDVGQAPSTAQAKALAEVMRPSFEFYESPKARISDVERDLKRYTHEQSRALDAMEANKRVVFQGPAGTGKTLLAIEAARRAAAKKRKVLVLCFNQLLARWLVTQAGEAGQPITVRSFHQHLLRIARISPPANANSAYWEDILPAAAIEHLLADDSGVDVFDEIVIDEAQDLLRASYLDVVDLSLKGGMSAGRWRLFGDFENQAIYGAATDDLFAVLAARAPGTAAYRLSVNCRNTPRVAELIHLLGGLTPPYSEVRRPDDGADPELRYYESREEQAAMLEKTLARLTKDGYSAGDIVVLSPLARDSCANGFDVPHWRGRIVPLGTGKALNRVTFGTVHAFKGLEAKAIILTDVEEIGTQAAQALFYVGASRATHQLTILANKNVKAQARALILRDLAEDGIHGG